MKKSIFLFPVEQPIGIFYIGKILTKDLLNIFYVNRRAIDKEFGIQRDVGQNRLYQIKNYLKEPDAVFPTSIIINIDSSNVIINNFCNSDSNLVSGIIVEYDSEKKDIVEIIDGQHRIVGLKEVPEVMKELPIVCFFDLEPEDKAYIFSVINSNQKQVNKSLIYDLFDLYGEKSPMKFCHKIVKTLNTDKSSPLFSRIKMIGKKTNVNESISQASLIDGLLELVGKDVNTNRANTGYIFRNFYDLDEETVVYKIVYNYFNACKNVFPKEWGDFSQFILTKTTGFGALLKALPSAYKSGLKVSDLSFEYFYKLMEKTKNELIKENKSLTRESFGVGESAQKDLCELFIKSWQ